MEIAEANAKYVDLPEVSETFADHVGLTTFDGHLLRIELQVTRVDPPKPPGPPTGRRYPACRLVLTGPAVLKLHNQLTQILTALEQQGLVKRGVDAPKTKQ